MARLSAWRVSLHGASPDDKIAPTFYSISRGGKNYKLDMTSLAAAKV